MPRCHVINKITTKNPKTNTSTKSLSKKKRRKKTEESSQDGGRDPGPVLDDNLEPRTAVPVLQQSGDDKLQQNQLQLHLSNGADGASHRGIILLL